MKNFDLKQSWRKIIASVLVISLCLIAFFPLTKAQSADLPLSRKLKITEASSEAADLAIQLAANSVYTLEVLSSNLNGAWRIRNSGTAILLDESGYFLTLASSIAQACDREGKIKPRTVIRVSNALPKAEFECELLARDYETDLAILKLKPGQKASSLPTLDLENSRAVSL
ncbi:MAG: S1C family serine protease, partial [Eubacteriales bacterium]|nr:S1C family serine protease [Eubacteriales bacterium]